MASLDDTLDSFYAGDAARLERSLRTDSTLVNARVASSTGHYCGYFHRATLLHHVAATRSSVRCPPTPSSSRAFCSILAPRSTPRRSRALRSPDGIGWR
jgi:hypothetical protein